MTLTLIFQGQIDFLSRIQYQKWILHVRISKIRGITSVSTAINRLVTAKVFGVKMTLTTTFQGQDDPEWSKQYQKWIPHTRISWNRGITRVYTLKNTKNRFSSWPMAAIFDFAPRSHIFLIWALDTRTKIVLYTVTLKLVLKMKVSGPPTINNSNRKES